MTTKTCRKCQHFTYDNDVSTHGSCALMGDYNDIDYQLKDPVTDRAYGWDYEGYKAGVYVGRDFGCIHWEKKQ